MEKTFNQEQDELFNYFLNIIYKSWNEKIKIPDSVLPTLNIFITPECNQACEYCYLQQNKDKLFPKEQRNNEQILNNLRKLFNYLIEDKKITNIQRIDLFSGEIWGYPLGNMVLNILLEYMDQGLTIEEIMIPSNCSFCASEYLLKIINDYVQKFKRKKVKISFSISMDGPIVDEKCRPSVFGKKDNKYYENIITFAKENDFGFHPMISANSLPFQKENYDNWIELLKQLGPDILAQYGRIMQLEVRSREWTQNKIEEYLDWLDYIFKKDLEVFFNNDIEKYFATAFHFFEKDDKNLKFLGYIPYQINQVSGGPTCSFGSSITVRLGDLKIFPCHRLCYDNLALGQYEIDKNKIINTKAYNPSLANSVFKVGTLSKPYCEGCPISKFCIKGCYGTQYEENKEMFFPLFENCNLQKAKTIYSFLAHKHLGIEAYAEKHPDLKRLVKDINSILEREEYQEWIKLITKKYF